MKMTGEAGTDVSDAQTAPPEHDHRKHEIFEPGGHLRLTDENHEGLLRRKDTVLVVLDPRIVVRGLILPSHAAGHIHRSVKETTDDTAGTTLDVRRLRLESQIRRRYRAGEMKIERPDWLQCSKMLMTLTGCVQRD